MCFKKKNSPTATRFFLSSTAGTHIAAVPPTWMLLRNFNRLSRRIYEYISRRLSGREIDRPNFRNGARRSLRSISGLWLVNCECIHYPEPVTREYLLVARIEHQIDRIKWLLRLPICHTSHTTFPLRKPKGLVHWPQP
jgi:hypothetical protein